MLDQAQLAAPCLRPIGTDRQWEGRGNSHLQHGHDQGDVLEGWQRGRIILAAEFVGRSLFVYVMKLRVGDSDRLYLRVKPKFHDDPSIERWRYGNKWAYQPVPPVWPFEDVDPWEEATYSGPIPKSAHAAAGQPCGSCGAASSGDANYCDQCAFPTDPVEALATVLGVRSADSALGSPTAGADLAALIERYTKGAKSFKRGRAELLELIKSDFAESAGARCVRVEPTKPKAGLTLAIAQDIHQSVAEGGRVLPEQVEYAERLLRSAPFHFGYWGPFKALVKSVPVDDLADAYAEALARLSSKYWSSEALPSAQVEDVGFLKDVFPAASPATVKYLARRARRDLAKLAEESLDTYAQVATQMLLCWDEDLSRNSFAPAYVMLGGRKYLDKHSKHVVVSPDMSSRCDAHPEIWNARPDLVQEIFDGITESTEAQTWAFQVLESVGQAPAITGDHVKLALRSTYAPLNLAACTALSSRPGMWDSLTVAQWLAFFRNGDDVNVEGILDAMSAGTVRPAAVDAAREFLVSGVAGTSSRMLRISLMFLAETQATWRNPENIDARTAAVTLVMTYSATKHKKLWTSVLRELDLEHLKRVRQGLPERTARSATDKLDDLILDMRALRASIFDAFSWIVSDDPREVKHGWALVKKGYGLAGLLRWLPGWVESNSSDPVAVERVLADVIPRVGILHAPSLAEVVEAAIRRRGVNGANLIESLTKTASGLEVLWTVIGSDGGNRIASPLKKVPAAVRSLGDTIQPEQLGSATPGQLSFVLRYITDNPSRIAGDMAFGCAAAVSAQPTLQREAIKQLRKSGHMPEAWRALAESAVPAAREAARDYLGALQDGREFRDAVLTCMADGVPEVRLMGKELLEARLEQREDSAFWTALAESDDPHIEDIVAAEPRIADRVDEQVLAGFDRRVLLSQRRASRRTKEKVKARIQATQLAPGPASQDRITALLELARGQILKDRDWALQELTRLALSGVPVDGLDVSLVTTGDAS